MTLEIIEILVGGWVNLSIFDIKRNKLFSEFFKILDISFNSLYSHLYTYFILDIFDMKINYFNIVEIQKSAKLNCLPSVWVISPIDFHNDNLLDQ